MNVAFPAIIAFLLLLPGIILIRLRPPRRSSEPPQITPISAEAGLIAISALLLHAVWVTGTAVLLRIAGSELRPSPKSVLMLLAGRSGSDDRAYDLAADALAHHPYPVFWYFILLYALAAFLALRRGQKFDECVRRIGMLPPEGRESEWREFFREREKLLTIVTAVVEMGGKAYLFVGELERLWFDQKTGELDRFALSDVWRRKIDQESSATVPLPSGWRETQPPEASSPGQPETEEKLELTPEQVIAGEYERIEGDIFVIRYSDTRNVNVRYFEQPKA